MSTIAERLSDFKKAKGLSNKQLGILIGTSDGTISRIETGHTESPGILIFLKLKEVFSLSPDQAYELVFGEKLGYDELKRSIETLDLKYEEAERKLDASEKKVEYLLKTNLELSETVNRLTKK